MDTEEKILAEIERLKAIEVAYDKLREAAQAVVGLKSLPVMSGYRELADQIDAAKDHLAAALKGDE
jgi:hypothetical protein